MTLASVDAEHVRIAVKDNGVGFDSTVQRAATHGLIGMRYRVEAEGGSMRLESTPGKGTLIEAILPVTDIDSAGSDDAAFRRRSRHERARPLPAGLSAASYERGVAPPTGPRARTLSPSGRLPRTLLLLLNGLPASLNPQTRHSSKEPR